MLINIKQDHNMILFKKYYLETIRQRAQTYIDWLEVNLKNSAVLKNSKKQVLKLDTELKVENSK